MVLGSFRWEMGVSGFSMLSGRPGEWRGRAQLTATFRHLMGMSPFHPPESLRLHRE